MNRNIWKDRSEDKLRQDYERNKRGIHSKQGAKLKFYGNDEHNEVLKILGLQLGREFDELRRDQRMSGEYVEIFYYIPSDSECVFDDRGDCIAHEEIKNYLAHGYIPRVYSYLNYQRRRGVALYMYEQYQKVMKQPQYSLLQFDEWLLMSG